MVPTDSTENLFDRSKHSLANTRIADCSQEECRSLVDDRSSDTRRAWLVEGGITLLFLAITLLAYFPALEGPFIWDDRSLVQENQFIRSPALLAEIFRHRLHLESASAYYRPIQNVSFLIDYFLCGENPFGFHLTNVLIQAACGWILYQLLRRFLPALLTGITNEESRAVRLGALAIALFWVVHPMHNAAVAYISGRADPLSFLLSATAISLTLVSRRWSGTWKQPTMLVCAWTVGLTALCTKEIAACWMMLFALYLGCFDRRCSRRAFVATIIAMLALLGIGWLLRQLPASNEVVPSPYAPTAPERVVLMLRALGDYTKIIVAPITLTMERTTWPEWGREHVTWNNLPMHLGGLGYLGVGSLIFAIAGALWRKKGQRLRVFGATWFGLCFLPISNLFPLNAQVAEHWIYLASVGALLFGTGLIVMLPKNWCRCATIVIAGAIPAMLMRTNLRAEEWADPVRFYSQIIQTTGGTPRVFNNLANIYRAKGDEMRAEQIYRAALDRYPNYSMLQSNYGKLLARQNRTAEAQALLAQAEEHAQEQRYIIRSGWHASVASAQIKMNQGLFDEALALTRAAREQAPGNWTVMQLYCQARERVEGPDSTLAELQEFASRQWWSKEPRLLLARKWLRKQEPQKALLELRHAARLDVWDPQPFIEISAIELEQRNLSAALEAQQAAVRRAPGNSNYRAALAYILHELGRENEALAQLQKSKWLEQHSERTKG